VPCTLDAIFPGVLHSGAGTPRTLGAAGAEDASQAPAEDLAPSMIVGDSIVRYVRATLAK
ncbi:hypothetical protein M9458_010293, partial [Cirrhinus mrigala]